MLLDLEAARAVSRARLFERAVNDIGPWAIRIGDKTVWAVRIRMDSGVLFVAHFDEGVEPEETVAWLLCRGEELSSKDITPPADHAPFGMEWRITMGESRAISSDKIEQVRALQEAHREAREKLFGGLIQAGPVTATEPQSETGSV